MPAQSRQHANSRSLQPPVWSARGKKTQLGRTGASKRSAPCNPGPPWSTERAQRPGSHTQPALACGGTSLSPCREMRKQPKRGTGADSQSHKPSSSCYADSACSGKVWTAPAVCLGMLEGSSKPQGQQPGEQPHCCCVSACRALLLLPPPRHHPGVRARSGAPEPLPKKVLVTVSPSSCFCWRSLSCWDSWHT